MKTAFDAHPDRVCRTMMQLRVLIFEKANTDKIGGVIETLKWG